MPDAEHLGPGGDAVLFLLFVALPVAALAAYLAGAWNERDRWSHWRTLSFTLGVGLVLAATSPPVTEWARQDLNGHMARHLLLGMYAPIALVLGAPVTLLLRRLPAPGGRAVVAMLDARPVRCLVHPVTAALLDVGGMYVLYLTPLYAWSLADPAVHVLVHVHFVLSGYLFAWSIAGPDPAPRRPGFGARMIVLLLAMAAHSTLAKLMYGYSFPRGAHAEGSAESGAMLMYYGGDLAELAIAIALFAAWHRSGARRGRGAVPAA